jgi:hypothetical protein
MAMDARAVYVHINHKSAWSSVNFSGRWMYVYMAQATIVDEVNQP